MFYLNIFIPYSFNYYILQNNNIILNKHKIVYIYIYNEFFYIILNLSNSISFFNNFFINNSTNMIKLNFIKNPKINNLNSQLNRYFFSLDHIFFKKIKFTGKGFKIKKKKNNIILYFNTSHLNLFINNKSILIRLSKSKYIILESNIYNLIYNSILFRSVRPNNIFTKRGLRLTRQLVLKKKGKN